MALSIATKIQIVIPQQKGTGPGNIQFSSELPQELNGIITPEEFRQSIININQTYQRAWWETLLGTVVFLCFLAGTILFSILPAQTIQNNAIIPVIIAAGTLYGIGTFVCFGGLFYCYCSFQCRLKKVLADESMKYSMRLMLPITWRRKRQFIPSDPDEDNSKNIENLIIEIGPSTDSEMRNNTLNFNSAEPTSYIGQQYPILPPSYIGQQYPILPPSYIGQQYPMFPFSLPSAIHSSYITSYP